MIQIGSQPLLQTGIVRGACPHDCLDTCAMLVHVRDDRASRVQGVLMIWTAPTTARRSPDGTLAVRGRGRRAAQALGPARPGASPWHTVNVAGSLVLGLVLALVPADDPRHLRPLLAVGFCGGLTTFSTFGYETVSLLQARAYGTALAYAGGSFALALAAVVIGLSFGARLR